MAQFRRNHQRKGRSFGVGLWKRLFFLAALVLGLLYVLSDTDRLSDLLTSISAPTDPQGSPGAQESAYKHYLPAGGPTGSLVHHKYFSLSYNEKHEQANWVAYELTANQLYAKNVKRSDYFDADPKVPTGSATYGDYKGSGYSKGHLVPSADRNFSREANVETFYLSNISPQKIAFNSGVWNELEMSVRNWAIDNKKLVIVTGPIIPDRPKKIGKNEVSVPSHFFKVVLDASDPEIKAIAFVMPNERCEKPLADYIKTVDEVEKITGLDFFSTYLPREKETEVEAKSDASLWRFDPDLYDTRINNWNRRN